MNEQLSSSSIAPWKCLIVLVNALLAAKSYSQTFTVLHDFAPGSSDPSGLYYTNIDGISFGGLLVSGSTLYGVAGRGGSLGNGTIFAVNTDGTGFTNLHTFTGASDDAATPRTLILLENTLYGLALGGGTWGNGTMFRVNTDGTGFTNLYSFTGGSDGAGPDGRLFQSGNTLYGTASQGANGVNGGSGTISAIP